MNYEIDKKSFYLMMEKVFNELYGDDYVKYNNMQYERIKVLNQTEPYKCQMEKNVLTDRFYRGILVDEQIVKYYRKCGEYYLNESFFDNSTFKICNCELNQLIVPYVIEFPFLTALPLLVDEIYKTTKNNVIVFGDEEVSVITEILKEYKTVHDEEVSRGKTRIRSKF